MTGGQARQARLTETEFRALYDRLRQRPAWFDDLVPLCELSGRWSFLCVIAPLRLPGGTGSPVNPIAIL